MRSGLCFSVYAAQYKSVICFDLIFWFDLKYNRLYINRDPTTSGSILNEGEKSTNVNTNEQKQTCQSN